MLTNKQRAYLRSKANTLNVLTQIGKEGVSRQVIAQVDGALRAHELIKLHVLENSGEDPYVLLQELAAELEAEPVAVVGRKIVLYRASKKHPTIELPKA